MTHICIRGIAVVILLCGFLQIARAEVTVYVGYLNNLDGVPKEQDIPRPFDRDATTVLISSGGASSLHDTGVIRFENRTGVPVTIDRGLRVTTERGVFQIWDNFLPVVLNPNANLVLAETENFNFDSSDSGLGREPEVSGRVNGVAFSFVDTSRVLLGHEESASPAETTSYKELGTVGPDIHELLSYQASGYKFLIIPRGTEPPAGFEQPGFDDSSFSSGAAAFGSGGGCPLQNTVKTAWRVNSQLLIRRAVSIPPDAVNVRIMVAIDNNVTAAFFNGTRTASNVLHQGCAVLNEFTFDVPQELVQSGSNLIAFQLEDLGGESFFDARITAEFLSPPINVTGVETFINTASQAIAITQNGTFVIDVLRGGPCVCIPNRCCCGPIGEPCKWCPGPRPCLGFSLGDISPFERISSATSTSSACGEKLQ